MQRFPHGRIYLNEKLCVVQALQKGIRKIDYTWSVFYEQIIKSNLFTQNTFPAMNKFKVPLLAQSIISQCELSKSNFNLIKRRQ